MKERGIWSLADVNPNLVTSPVSCVTGANCLFWAMIPSSVKCNQKRNTESVRMSQPPCAWSGASRCLLSVGLLSSTHPRGGPSEMAGVRTARGLGAQEQTRDKGRNDPFSRRAWAGPHLWPEDRPGLRAGGAGAGMQVLEAPQVPQVQARALRAGVPKDQVCAHARPRLRVHACLCVRAHVHLGASTAADPLPEPEAETYFCEARCEDWTGDGRRLSTEDCPHWVLPGAWGPSASASACLLPGLPAGRRCRSRSRLPSGGPRASRAGGQHGMRLVLCTGRPRFHGYRGCAACARLHTARRRSDS